MNTLTDQFQLVKTTTLDVNFIQTLLGKTVSYNDGYCRELFRDGRHLKSLRSPGDTFSARKGDTLLSVNMGVLIVTFTDKFETRDVYHITCDGAVRLFVLDPRIFAVCYIQGIDPLQRTVEVILAALKREVALGKHDDMSDEYLRHVIEYKAGVRAPMQTQHGVIEVTTVKEYGIAIWDVQTMAVHADPKRIAEIDGSKHVEKAEARIEREQEIKLAELKDQEVVQREDLRVNDVVAQQQRVIDERKRDEMLADDRAKWEEQRLQQAQDKLREAATDLRIEQAQRMAAADKELIERLRRDGYSTADILQHYPEMRYSFEKRDIVTGALFNEDEIGRLTAAEPTPTDSVSSDSKPDEVLFSAFHPRDAPVDAWATMVVYAHKAALFAQVESDVRQLRADLGDAPRRVVASATVGIPRGTEITFVPHIAGVQFNPETITLKWFEDLHRVTFRFLPGSELADSAGNGEIIVFASTTVGPLPIARLKLAMIFSKSPLALATYPPAQSVPAQVHDAAHSTGRTYKHIFASYSHEDVYIVQEFSSAYKILGISMLADYESLLSGQTFATELMRLIESADAFQLFWSKRSAASAWVRREWEHALSCNRDGFILPVYWEAPMPSPPPELAHLHFASHQIHRQPAHEPSRSIFARLLGRSSRSFV